MHRRSSSQIIWWACRLSALFVFLAQAQHQPEAGGEASPATDAAMYEGGFHLGNLLPNQIAGVTEIVGLGGVRLGARIAPLTYAEAGLITGNGHGASWKNAHVDVRMDIPVENLVGMAYIGVDTVYYETTSRSAQVLFGGHVGGGLMAHFSGNVWFRGDMKFSFSPGTSLYVGFGLVIRLPDK